MHLERKLWPVKVCDSKFYSQHFYLVSPSHGCVQVSGARFDLKSKRQLWLESISSNLSKANAHCDCSAQVRRNLWLMVKVCATHSHPSLKAQPHGETAKSIHWWSMAPCLTPQAQSLTSYIYIYMHSPLKRKFVMYVYICIFNWRHFHYHRS